MPEARQSSRGIRDSIDELWRRQWLVASAAQLKRRGMTKDAIGRAVAAGRLCRVHRGIYSAIPADLLSVEGRMAAAILLGGRGAVLCEATATWWLSLTKRRPPKIHVATRYARRPAEGIEWHRLSLRASDVMRHRGFPTTTPQRALLDLAATKAPDSDLLRAMAEAEFHHGIGAAQLATQQGHPGSARLRCAIERHTPQLANTRSELEQAFVLLLRRRGLKQPLINHPVNRSTVDAIYDEERIAIELDGVRGHSGQRRILRDHRRDLHRRNDGFLPLRYHYTQITNDEELVVGDLRRAGVPDAARGGARRLPRSAA
jgi:very-short-patch-repair endonuclease